MNTAEGSALQAYPGEDFHVFVSGWDELGNPTQGVYRIQENEDESDNEVSGCVCSDQWVCLHCLQ